MHPPPLTAWANFALMMECTPESSRCYSVYSVVEPLGRVRPPSPPAWKRIGISPETHGPFWALRDPLAVCKYLRNPCSRLEPRFIF